MKQKKRKVLLLGLFFLMLSVGNGSFGQELSVKAAGETGFTAEKSTICTGKRMKLTLKGKKRKVVFKSSNPKVAVVSQKGYVTGRRSGTTVITAKSGKKTWKCKVTVKKHTYGKATCTKASVCKRCGLKKGKALGHSYKPATCTKGEVCRRCGKTKGKALGHTYRISGEKKICRRCGKKTQRDYKRLTEKQVYDAMMSLQKKYPQGMPWTNEDFYAWKGGIYDLGFGCAGFAFRLSDEAFGDLPARMHRDFSKIKVGDILRINGNTHSVIVLDVDGGGVTIAEGNYNASINWGRYISFDTLEVTGDYVMTRYPE